MFSNNKQEEWEPRQVSFLADIPTFINCIFFLPSLRWIDCLFVTTPGNAQTLKQEPKKKKINVYKRLRAFWKKHYSAHYMTLAVQSKG